MKYKIKITQLLLAVALVFMSFTLLSLLYSKVRNFNFLIIFIGENLTKEKILDYNIKILLAAFICVIVGIGVQILIRSKNKKFLLLQKESAVLKVRIFIYIIFAILFLFVTYKAYYIYTRGEFRHLTDPGYVYDLARGAYSKDYTGAPEDLIPYFEFYPNNLPAALFSYCLFSLFRSVHPVYTYFFHAGIQIVLLIMISNTYYMKNKKLIQSILPLFIFLFFIPNFMYIAYPYPDIIGMNVLLLFHLCLLKNIWKKKKIFFLFSVLVGIFFALRATMILAVIAYIAVYIIFSSKKCTWNTMKNKILLAVISVVIIFASMFITTLGSRMFFHIDTSKAAPTAHWINMGQNDSTFGVYSHEDVRDTQEMLQTADAKTVSKKMSESAFQRFWKRGIKGNVKFYLDKIGILFGDGDFGATQHAVYFNRAKAPILFTKKFYMLQIFLDIFIRVFYILITVQILYFIKNPKRIQREFIFMLLVFMGFICFYALWEVQSRYGIGPLPLMIIVSLYTQMHLFDLRDRVEKNEKISV